MVDQLSSFADEVTRVAREVGTEGKLGGQAEPIGVSGTWKDLTDNVNFMASNLTNQVRNVATVATAVARGDLTRKITVDVRGEMLELKDTLNTMVDQLSSFADEVTRVAREVGTEGKLGGQAQVRGVSGTWKDLTDNVNSMADNLTGQVRNIAQVTTAVANGDLTQKITVDARGEILELKNTINTMVDQLSSFASEVTRVAREVGTEGKLGGQAQVEGVSGTWKRLTENVNIMAGSLTTQVRAIAEVSTAVAQGDLTRSITVDAEGEVAELKDNVNQMIANLRETTRVNEEQDWLKTNLARISGLMQGQRDLQAVSKLIMSEVTPVVSAHHGVFFLAEQAVVDGEDSTELRLLSSYGYKARKNVANRFKLGEGLVGQAALEKKTILLTQAPGDYIKVSSGLGETDPVNVVVLPLLFEDQVLGVIELGSVTPFTPISLQFLDQLIETIGVVLNTIIANMRTEELLEQSQRLAEELQERQEELQTQQEELRRSNAELESQAASLRASEELLQQQQEELQQTNEELQEKARLLEEQNRAIEVKNAEIETARLSLEEKAEQLAVSSKYKSEFLANMSHELRTPLNSLLILAKLLGDNGEGNLTERQVEFARTIHGAGAELLELINDILDLSKVEAGKMDVTPGDIALAVVADNVRQSFDPVAEQNGLAWNVVVEDDAPPSIFTDDQRLQQILKNLLSNAFKFTESGGVELRIGAAGDDVRFDSESLTRADRVVAFDVVDTGVGIPADKLRLIFEAFQQADGTTSRRFGGTGLGLTISRDIARLLGGEIRVRSEVGAGSTFTLYLPAAYRPPAVGATLTAPSTLLAPVSRPAPGDPATAGASVTAPAASSAISIATEPDTEQLLAVELDDDRDAISQGDRVLLVVEHDEESARAALRAGRRAGYRVIVALRAGSGLALAREYKPDAIVLDADLPSTDGVSLLAHLKRESGVRHIPVHVVGDSDVRHHARRTGAVGFSERPASGSIAEATYGEVVSGITTFLDNVHRRLLVVEDDAVERGAIAELIGGGGDVEIVAVGSSEEALEALEGEPFSCVVLDLKLPKMTGFTLLEKIKTDERFVDVPVVVYTGRELTRREETRLRKYAETIVVKDANSPERLLDETALYLHRAPSTMPAPQRRMIEQLLEADRVFQGKRILVIDDDVRNVFALTSALESRGMQVLFAENGRDGIEVLKANPGVDLILMDVMMPEMDGYQTTRAVRQIPQFRRLPIIALTAKAMKGDREKSIAAGASDYITKPVDIDQLVSLMRVWLYE
jgi:signal transduction histidine kinase/CheY-like chemotaxis protein/HAMP domain-containing protein